MIEIFKDIKEYENLYQISNFGNVKSLPKGDGNGNRERLLKFESIIRNHTTYYRVTLSKNGKTKRFLVHRLVAQHFLDNPYNKPMINHIDNNGTNNKINNLEWCTASENMQHSHRQNRQEHVKKAAAKARTESLPSRAQTYYASLVGTKIGTLTILSYSIDYSLKRPCPKFSCICDCGNNAIKNIDQLRYKNKSCSSCSHKNAYGKRKLHQDKDIVSTI